MCAGRSRFPTTSPSGLGAVAAERGVAPEDLVGEAVAEKFPPRRKLGFIGIGHSGRGDISANIKQLRRELVADRLQKMADERRPAEG